MNQFNSLLGPVMHKCLYLKHGALFLSYGRWYIQMKKSWEKMCIFIRFLLVQGLFFADELTEKKQQHWSYMNAFEQIVIKTNK